MPPRNALYAQSGGVTATLNTTACAVIETARKHRARIGRVYAARNGIIGALEEDLVDTSRESAAAIRALKHTPGAAYGSCRYDLDDLPKGRAQYERLIEVFRAHDIGYVFYNGGNGSADTTWKIATHLPRMGYPVVAVGVPKTIDNDIVMTDCCPGYGSVAKYVATSMREGAADLAAMARSSTQVFIMEVMGRHTGWVAAACGLAAERAGDAPHIVLVPEIRFSKRRFLARVKDTVARHGHCAIAVAEGLRGKDGKLYSLSVDDHVYGHEQLGGIAPALALLIRRELDFKVHWSVLDYLQRSARHIASKTDLEQSYAVGRAAVELAASGRTGVIPLVQRRSTRPYRWTVEAVELKDVMNHERNLPRDFMTPDGFHISARCRRYLAPLVAGEAHPPFEGGLPVHARLRHVRVRRRLKSTYWVPA